MVFSLRIPSLGFLLVSTLVACAADNSGGCPDEPGVICTVMGTGKLGFNGDERPAIDSDLYWPVDITFDPNGHTYLLDWNNHRVRERLPDGTLLTVVGTDFIGDGPDDLSDLTPEGALGTDVNLNHPTQMVSMPDGKPILVSWHNHKLRRLDPKSGRVWVIAGSAPGFAGDGGPASDALFNQPSQATADRQGALYVLDQRNQVIRRIDKKGIVETIAGIPTQAGFAGDGGPATEAMLAFPAGSNPPPAGGLALDDEDHLYVSDTLNHRIRVIDLTTGVIDTLAGTGKAGFGGDGGPATKAKLNNPRKLALGPDGKLYVGDERNHRIRVIDLTTGVIDTAVGNGKGRFAGDGGPAKSASLKRPTGVAFDEDGAMYVIDTYNSRVRRVGAMEETK